MLGNFDFKFIEIMFILMIFNNIYNSFFHVSFATQTIEKKEMKKEFFLSQIMKDELRSELQVFTFTAFINFCGPPSYHMDLMDFLSKSAGALEKQI